MDLNHPPSSISNFTDRNTKLATCHCTPGRLSPQLLALLFPLPGTPTYSLLILSVNSDITSSDSKSPGSTENLALGALQQQNGASLVVQWLRIRLPMQGTQVPSLVREDPTCRGVTKPVHHNY